MSNSSSGSALALQGHLAAAEKSPEEAEEERERAEEDMEAVDKQWRRWSRGIQAQGQSSSKRQEEEAPRE